MQVCFYIHVRGIESIALIYTALIAKIGGLVRGTMTHTLAASGIKPFYSYQCGRPTLVCPIVVELPSGNPSRLSVLFKLGASLHAGVRSKAHTRSGKQTLIFSYSYNV